MQQTARMLPSLGQAEVAAGQCLERKRGNEAVNGVNPMESRPGQFSFVTD